MGMVDIHCHILPGIDDGPASMAEALQMARIAAADGIRKMVATPHLTDLPSPKLIREMVCQLNAALADAAIPLEVLPGADASALLPADILRQYTINGTDYILFEFPHSHVPQNATELVFNVILAGMKPIITHPERNPSIVRRPEILFELVESGALVQLTAESLMGHFGPEAKACAEYLLDRRAAHFLATDAHSSHQRSPILSRGADIAAKIIGRTRAQALVTANPRKIIAGKPFHD
jgi:protein-tyrosine phosphatase